LREHRQYLFLAKITYPSNLYRGEKYQYATGNGSSERQMYQVATPQYGAQAAATSRISLRLTAVCIFMCA
jgi:hypothetical protein